MSYTRRKHTSLKSLADRMARAGKVIVDTEEYMSRDQSDSQTLAQKRQAKAVDSFADALDDYDIYLSGREEATE